MVNKKDFFLHLFYELMDPKSETFMFMYNGSETVAWFPAKVRLFSVTIELGYLLLQIILRYSAVLCCFINAVMSIYNHVSVS